MEMDLNPIYDDDDLEVVDLIIFGIPRRVYTRNDPMNNLDPQTFFQRFRMTRETVLEFLPQIEDRLEYPFDTNNCVAPINQFLIFLRFCATGCHLSTAADFGGVHLSTAGRIIARVARATAALYNNHIKFPSTPAEILESQTGFYEIARFPRVIGAVDCTHIKIESPGGPDAEVFRNRKGYFSLNVQVICNANLEAINVVARWPGSSHDSTIFNNSQIRRNFEQNRYPNLLLIGDSGYYLKPYLMTPHERPLLRSEQLYNESIIRTRNTIERYFGVLKRRFPALAYGLRLKLDTDMAIIVAAAVLNNVCRKKNEEPPPVENLVEFLRVLELHEVPNIPAIQPQNNPNRATAVRDNLIENYFANL